MSCTSGFVVVGHANATRVGRLVGGSPEGSTGRERSLVYTGLRCWAPANRLGSQVVLLAGWSTFLCPAAASSLLLSVDVPGSCSSMLSIDVPRSCGCILSASHSQSVRRRR